ncbi:MAG: GNAT family N-acetyltransferase [Clostridiales bacterium]|jgi:SAM-dependent methyltransferase/GNAT superfamily N-acetyltransferase|nr:GNAT family N-acetyltransferase [Clostridiales bacterium]
MLTDTSNNIKITRATESEIPVIEAILLDAVGWLNEAGQPLWAASVVKWDAISTFYQPSDFYIAYKDGIPSGCMAIVDYDPFFWPNVKKGESLFIHKLAVMKSARKTGVADALMEFFINKGTETGVKTLRLDAPAFRSKLLAFYERHGFKCVGTKTLKGERHTAFYILTLSNNILAQNKSSWNAIADSFFGVTALPLYGCLCPTEDDLHLFPNLSGRRILDIGCGSGHSLKWCADNGAGELWGLDMSDAQIKNAGDFLNESGCAPKLFCSPMERNPGLPLNYFDVVYSVYAIGWTVDLQETFNLISSYLKPGGVFIFSWDHPFLHCVDAADEKLIFSGSYYEAEPFTFCKGENRQNVRRGKKDGSYTVPEEGVPMTLYNRRLCDYINALSSAGFAAERVVEETDKDTLEREAEFSSAYYAPFKAKHFPMSIVIKARKL